jgi:hypothetical protein
MQRYVPPRWATAPVSAADRAVLAEALAEQLGRLEPGSSLLLRMGDDSSLQIGMPDRIPAVTPSRRGDTDPVGVTR